MELKEQIFAPTLAKKLGDTMHVSSFLRRLQQLTGCSQEQLPYWLLKSAVGRGASHYSQHFDPALPPDNKSISTEEIGVALCMGHMPDEPVFIRAAAQLLSSPKTDVAWLFRLAEMERTEPVLIHIAAACAKTEPEMEPWKSVREGLHCRRKWNDNVLPHWTRFVSMTGMTREGPGKTDWLCRHE